MYAFQVFHALRSSRISHMLNPHYFHSRLVENGYAAVVARSRKRWSAHAVKGEMCVDNTSISLTRRTLSRMRRKVKTSWTLFRRVQRGLCETLEYRQRCEASVCNTSGIPLPVPPPRTILYILCRVKPGVNSFLPFLDTYGYP